MKIKCEVGLFVVSILVLASAGQREEMLCKARPGCQLAKCDPGRFMQNLKTNEYPVTCIKSGGQEQALKEKYDELKKQLKSLRAGMRKLQTSNAELAKENTDFKRKATKWTKKSEELLAELRVVKAQISQSNTDNRELTAEVIVMKKEISQSSERNQEMSAELAAMKKQISQLSKNNQRTTTDACSSCEPPAQILFGTLQCSTDGYVVGTSCVVNCTNNHLPYSGGNYQLEKNATTCKANGEWSDDFPTCACPRCYTGDNCQWTTSWNQFKKGIRDDGGSSVLNYAGHGITTRVESGFQKWEWHSTCRCQDARINAHSVQCRRLSRYGSCEHACALLIKKMAAQGLYEPPCDPEKMNYSC